MSEELLGSYLSANRGFTLASSRGVVLEQRGMHAFLTGAPFASFNNVWVTERRQETGDDDRAAAYLRDCRLPLSAILPTGVPAEAAERLGLADLQPLAELPLMQRSITPHLDASAQDLPVRFRQLAPNEAGAHCRVAAFAFGMPSDSFDSVVTPEVLTAPAVAAFVGEAGDGTAVTTVLTVRAGATVAIFNLATEPSSRNSGYGSALTRYVLAVAAEQGASTALLLSGAEAVPLYSSLGFRSAMTVTYYLPQ